MAEKEEDYSLLPLPDRFAHKNWKVRKEGYEAAAEEFKNAQSPDSPAVRQFLLESSIWKAAVTDSNVAAHQEALVALCQFLDIAETQGCVRTRGLTIAPLAEKGLISTKPVAKQKALEAILLYVELDKADPVIEELLPLLSHKLPKVVAGVLSALTAMYHTFGCKTVDPKPVLKEVPKAFAHADKNVRQEAQNLMVELYRWLGEAIKKLVWNDLKPVQQQDLDKLFEKVKEEPSPKPERLLRSEQARIAAAPPPAADEAEAEVEEEPEIDLEPDAVDIFPKIPKDFQERMASAKWKDRKDALDELQQAANVPGIEDGPFDDIFRALAKSMKDANVAVVTVAANCIELLARGLQKSFPKYRTTVFEAILERFKERKQSVVDALAAAIDATVATLKVSDYLEGILEFLKHKNPQVKLETTRFLIRSLKATRQAPELGEVNQLSDTAKKLLTDSQETQRNAGAEILGVLLKIMGERIMNTHLDSLDDIRKVKIKEYADAAEVKAKYRPKAAPPPKAAPLPTKKPAAPGKRPAPAPARKIADEPPSTPSALRPQPTSRPTLAKPSAPRGLKAPSTLGSAVKKVQPPSAASSPRKAVISPPLDEPPKARPGLTGRPLGKPSEAPAPRTPAAPAIASMPSAERLELDELRAEVDKLRLSNERFSKQNQSLYTQIQELEDSNAQLIEDHTRDVLSIKAKETQLVRARSDAESAEQAVGSLQREVDRLKRELGRTARVASPRATPNGDYFYDEAPEGLASRHMSPLKEGKENLGLPGRPEKRSVLSPPAGGAFAPNPYPRPSPASPIRPQSASSTSSARPGAGLPHRNKTPTDGEAGLGLGAAAGAASRDGQESWRRAAEVTQNLKNRIEQMRARQAAQGNGVGRPH